MVKFVFPALRTLCETRGVIWSEVDLRWGITDEAKHEGARCCLSVSKEIRRSSVFVGILGEYYGWVPVEIPAGALERDAWLRDQRGRSVTELEILHGALNLPQIAEKAFFFFRAPAWTEAQALKGEQEFYYSETPRDRDLLKNLKERIAAQFAVPSPYETLQEFGDQVLERLSRAVDDLFPEGSRPDPLDRLAADHEAYAESRRRVYVGREETFESLDAHAASAEHPLVVVGESGSGKSALLANWTAHYRHKKPGRLLIEHYVGANADSADWAAMLRRLLRRVQPA